MNPENRRPETHPKLWNTITPHRVSYFLTLCIHRTRQHHMWLQYRSPSLSYKWDLDNKPTPSLCVLALHSRCSDPKLNTQHSRFLSALFSLVFFPRASCPHEPATALRSRFTDRRVREGAPSEALFNDYCMNIWSLKGVNGSIRRETKWCGSARALLKRSSESSWIRISTICRSPDSEGEGPILQWD
jgi:hypothetical protein